MLPLQQSVHHTKKDNTFLCYSLAVTDPGQIQDFYKALKLKHPTATHVLCAYKLWNSKFKGTDNLDNGDYGGSRQLLQALDYTKKQNTCIFLVRYYSGQKLGPYRFKVFNKVL